MAFSIDVRGIMRLDAWSARPWLVHGFSTLAAGDFRLSSAREAAALLGLDGPLITLKQVHSGRVLRADGDISGAEPRMDGDALVSVTAGETIGVRVADCLPMLIVDPIRRAIAAVHAGWRGSAARIAVHAVGRMREEYGSRPEDLEAAIGPCISAPCYEVGEDVAQHFEDGAVTRVNGRPRPHVDLVLANRLQLEAAGVLSEKIFGGGFCTFSDPRFYSHRRDGETTGRMVAFIGLR